jgi:hypothetical protein
VNVDKPRTPEEIRDAARAELPALVAIRKRLAALYEELRRTPEYQRRCQLEDDDPAAWPLDATYWLASSLCDDDLGKPLRNVIKHLRDDTSPQRWADAPARSKRRAEMMKARDAKEAKARRSGRKVAA